MCSSHYFSHSLISRWRVSYLHTCNPLASSAYYIYETIVSDRASTNEKIEARREEVASRLNSSDHDYLLISTSFAGIFWHSSFSFYKYNIALRDERYRERGRYATEDTRARARIDARVRVCQTDDKSMFFHTENIMRVRVHRCREEATQMLRLIVRADRTCIATKLALSPSYSGQPRKKTNFMLRLSFADEL